VALFNQRRPPERHESVDVEYRRLRAIRLAAEQELERLRRELGERVASVEAKERELADALARLGDARGQIPAGAESALVHAQVGLVARAQELNRREVELVERERKLVEEEAEIARKADALDTKNRLAQIEERLATLHEAEKGFARTQAELAEQSDELARREAAFLERRRGGAKPHGDVGLDRAALDELDERLRLLERQTREATDSSFDGGLRALEQWGARRSGPNP
jgi:DNA repair exonuclease SbcCD ATPase subunit